MSINHQSPIGAIQTPGSAGWFVAASAKTKIIAKNFSRSALVSEEATRILSNKLVI